jgi:xylulokinase
MSGKETLLMSIDLGTTFIKAGVYNHRGQLMAQASAEVHSESPSPGVFIQRGDDILQSVVDCMKAVSKTLGAKIASVEAIAFTGQMSGFMGVDKDWNDITTWSCSMDSRYIPYAQRQLQELSDDFLEISGTNAPQMAPKFEWFKTEFVEQSKRIAKYVMISGYIIGRLGDSPIEDAAIDKSYTQWTGLADVKNGAWSATLCDAVKMNQAHLPNIVGSSHICARLSKKMAELTGFTSGIPLVSGAGDKIAGCLGANVVNSGDMIFEASSYGAVTCCMDAYKVDTESRRFDIVPSAIDGQFYAMHFIIGSGITLDWFRKTFGEESEGKDGGFFELIDRKAEQIRPGCNGLMAIGLLGGSAMPLNGDLKGMWMGFDWSHKREHFYRALLESFCYDFSLTTKRLEEIYPSYVQSKVKIIGGGAKSRVWTQMNADVTGKTYQSLDREDVAMWGAAIIAGHAIGLFADMKQTANQNVHIVQEYQPDMEMHSLYRPLTTLYDQYTRELHPFFRRVLGANGNPR